MQVPVSQVYVFFFVVLGGLYFLNLFNITGNRIAG